MAIRDLIQKVAHFYQQPNEPRMARVNQFVDKNIPIPVVNPLAKMAGNVLFGHQIDPQTLQTREGAMNIGANLGMGLAGGMRRVGGEMTQPIAKRVANLLIERDTAGKISFDAVDDVMKMARNILKIKPKDMKYYSPDDMLDNLAKKLTENQQYALHDLPMENMGRGQLKPNPTLQAARRYLRGMGGKFQGSLPKNLNIDTAPTQPKGVPFNIPKLF